MANRTVKEAHSIKGQNPQHLVEKIIRTRIYDCRYWKEECFALTGELIVDKGVQLRYIGGVYGGNFKPTPFICLILKMLQIQPDKDIIVEFIKNEDYKYVRALGAFYMRLTGTSLDVYKYLEPLYNDFRKIRKQDKSGSFNLSHMDEFIDELLHEERACDVILPRLQRRDVLEQLEQIEPRISALEDDLDEMSSEESDVDEFKADLDAYKADRDKRDGGRSTRKSSPPNTTSTHRTRRRSRDRDNGRHHKRDREGRGDMREGRGDMREGRGDMREDRFDMREGRGDMREGRGDMREGRGDMRENRGDMRENRYDMRENRGDMRERRREREENKRGEGRRSPPPHHQKIDDDHHHRHHHHHSHQHQRDDEGKERKKEKHKRSGNKHKEGKKRKERDGGQHDVEDEEIREQNELRAKLGLPPLK